MGKASEASERETAPSEQSPITPLHGWRRVRTLYYGFTTLLSANFLLSFTSATLGYVHSSFLGTHFSPFVVTFLFSVLAIVNILLLAVIPSILRLTGTRRMLIFLIPVAQIAVLFYGLGRSAPVIITFFVIQGAAITLMSFLLDLYLESIMKNETETGNVRSIFLTSANIAVFLAPLAIALFVQDDYYSPLFALSAMTLAFVFALSLTTFKKLKSVIPQRNSLREAISSLLTCHVSIAYTIGAHLLLQMFFAWATIYATLFLIQSGYSWQVAGLIIALAQVPYLVLEIPIGVIADRYFGETEIMTIGFVILGLAVASLSFIPITLIILWGTMFVVTRIGAAMIEITTESYFFKNVDGNDSALVSLFRMLRPLGLLFGSLIGLAIIPAAGLQYLFAFLGAILLVGVTFTLRIRDTK